MLTIDGATFADGSSSLGVSTDGAGAAAFEFELVEPTREVTVVATAPGPADAEVYVGAAAEPVDHRAQTLITAGQPAVLTASASITVQQPSTTTTPAEPSATTVEPSTTTTTAAPTTMTVAATTTTDAPATTGTFTSTTAAVVSETQVVPTTVPDLLYDDVNLDEPSTTTATASTTSTAPTNPMSAPTSPTTIALEIPEETRPLPKTGSANQVAYLGTSLLVAGVGVVGAIRRRLHAGHEGDASGDGDGFW